MQIRELEGKIQVNAIGQKRKVVDTVNGALRTILADFEETSSNDKREKLFIENGPGEKNM